MNRVATLVKTPAAPVLIRYAVRAAVTTFALGSAGSAIAFLDGGWAARTVGDAFKSNDFENYKKTETGLEFSIIEEGSGVQPKVGQKISVHYTGYLLNGTKFDSSYDRGDPISFAVGTRRVIAGWDEALLDMRVGEKRLLKIPPQLAYGQGGTGTMIPPNSTLVFYVELMDAADGGPKYGGFISDFIFRRTGYALW
jgi:peptidylprolyl isomerase